MLCCVDVSLFEVSISVTWLLLLLLIKSVC